MQYRQFGKLDWNVSALGFGAMRLPVIDNDPTMIEEEQATRMVRYAIDRGVNYVDTAYPYHGGSSEKFLGRALKDGYREKIKLATKLPSWLVQTREDFDRFLDEQLERLQTDHIDFYLLHNMKLPYWSRMRELKVFDWVDKVMADGRIRHLGFSFHDKLEVFKDVVNGYDSWTFCQIQYNYMDVDYQAGMEGLKYAAGKGLAVVVMEPIRGGRLAQNIPPAVQDIWDHAPRQATPADWALQWVWNQPEVSLLLSGMSTPEQVEQNLESAKRSGVGILTSQELALYPQVREKYQQLCPIPCTNCQYCMPCPSGVNIPRILEIYNDTIMYDSPGFGRFQYSLLPEDQRATSCVECMQCVESCPQQIEIPEWLAKAHEVVKPL